ncbi:metallopeptidase TldD-related protein [Sphingomonas sp. CFBP8993]|uniref:metallopeptidase TldD-related protein n=1 Tax=Sphingomonas sp. CFBP8993 TaxID=3096526 RepID=UPI002A6AE480|nr:metallopeptidase TldD-related protein [Sphingomonas sp. CFBP8993]MDY0958811.1 metallopeptidase TldD-related protein [Sphingomonas sp. CFBP8993]
MTSAAMDRASTRIFAPAGLDRTDVGRALGRLAVGGADLGDLYFETRSSRNWRLEDGRVTAGGFGINQGVGARIARGAEVAFAYSADMRPEALAILSDTVYALGRAGGGHVTAPITLNAASADHGLYPTLDPVADADAARWIALLERVETLARAADPRIVRVDANLSASEHVVLVADLDGHMRADVRPMVQLRLTIVAEANGRRARGFGGLGGRHDLSGLREDAIARAVSEATTMALVNLDARPAPAGTFPIVLGPGYPGVLFHEAVGHGLEGDHHRQGLSAFAGRVGERIAASGVTVIDDGGLPGRIGSLGMDDEGTAPEKTVLVRDGILTGLMQDRLNAGLMNARPTGNGRRQSHAHLPMPRMTNTYLAAGQDDPADILRSVSRGIYATAFGGGQVDITSGRFNFSTTAAWLIEDGRLTAPIEGATLIGVGHEALKHISMVGHDLALDDGVATCGKQGQTLDVGVGQPTIRIDAMMVGGRGG